MPSPVRIRLTQSGSLSSRGYGMRKSAKLRRVALAKAIRVYGPTSVMRKLQVLMLYNRNRNPTLYNIARRDRDWIKRTYGTTASPSPRSPLRRSKRSPSRRSPSRRSPSRRSPSRRSPSRRSPRRRSGKSRMRSLAAKKGWARRRR